jgi:putative endopeptidase
MRKIFLLTAIWAGCNLSYAQNHAINLDHMDKSVRPQDDFYNYVNGNWMKTTTIPSDKARWGSFDELRENTDEAALKILKESLGKTYAWAKNCRSV